MKDDPIMAEVDGEGMIIDVDRGTCYFLNETALLIYKMVKDGKGSREIRDVLTRDYDVDEGDAESDITAFLKQLQSKAAAWEKRDT